MAMTNAKVSSASSTVSCVAGFLTLHLALAQAASATPFKPVSFHIELDAVQHNAYVASIRNNNGMPVYELRLDPVFDVANDVTGWDVSVFDLQQDHLSDQRNLLAPRGNWHGLQPFMIRAGGNDVFGRKRTVSGDGISCVIEVIEQKTLPSEVLPGARVFESARILLQLRPQGN